MRGSLDDSYIEDSFFSSIAGVYQGESLSPFLFSMSLNDLHEDLKSNDDVGIMQRGRHIKSILSLFNLCKGMSLGESGSRVTSYKISVLSVNTLSLFLLNVVISPRIREGVNVAPFDGYAFF